MSDNQNLFFYSDEVKSDINNLLPEEERLYQKLRERLENRRLDELTERENYVMDETDVSFKEGEYERTLEDDLELLEIVKRDGLELDSNGELYKLAKELNYFGEQK